MVWMWEAVLFWRLKIEFVGEVLKTELGSSRVCPGLTQRPEHYTISCKGRAAQHAEHSFIREAKLKCHLKLFCEVKKRLEPLL